MTKSGRKASGIIAMIGGGLQFIGFVGSLFIYLSARGSGNPPLMASSTGLMIIFVFFMVCGVSGGFLLLKDKTLGAVFCIFAGVLVLAHALLAFSLMDGGSIQFGSPIYVDALLLLIGGIQGLAFGSEGEDV